MTLVTHCVAALQCCSSKKGLHIPKRKFYIYINIYIYIYIYIESYFLHLRNLIFNCNTATTATLQHCNVVCFPKTQSCEPSDSGVEEVNNLNTFTSSKKKLNFFEKNS